MRILLTNDDGIEATGLGVLEKIATDLTDDVWVVAPETDNSGASHSLTLAEPLRMRELDKRHYAVKGTPTDCVIMGVASCCASSRQTYCCRVSIAGRTSPMMSPIPARSPGRSKGRCWVSPPSP